MLRRKLALRDNVTYQAPASDMANTKRIPMTRRASTPARRLGAGWLVVLFATLFAFTSQSIVLGTHQHVDSVVTSVADTAVKASPGQGSPADSPANCPICRELAHSGAYLTSTPIAFDLPAPFHTWQVATIVSWPRIAQPPLGWRSRAPPLQLQA